jgi:hypothetical protein
MLKKLNFAPGINRRSTQYAAEGNWYDGNLIRFRDEMPEKIGGWTKYSTNTFLGIARSLLGLISFSGVNILIVGSDKKVYAEVGGTYYDITPIQYDDIGATTLAVDDSSSTTTIQVDFVTSDKDVLRLASDANINGDELIYVATGQAAGDDITSVVRGAFGTTPSSHGIDDAVYRLANIPSPIHGVMGETRLLINHPDHGLVTGDFVTFLKIDTSLSLSGLTRQNLFYNSTSGFDKTTSNQSFYVSKVLTSDYYEVDGPSAVTGLVTSTLHEELTVNASSIIITANTALTLNDYVKVDDEYIKLTNGGNAGTPETFTCDRGQLGSIRATHDVLATVNEVSAAAGGDCIILRDHQASESTFAESAGWSAGSWGGVPSTTTSTMLNDASGITVGGDPIIVDSTTAFPSAGVISIDSELISYTTKTGGGGTQFGTLTRGDLGTTAAVHSDNTTVFEVDVYWTPWGGPTVAIPGENLSSNIWSIDSFGEDLVLAKDRGAPYYWNTTLKMKSSMPYVTTYNSADTDNATGICLADAVLMSSLGVPTDPGYGSVPAQVGFLKVFPASRQIIAFGCTDTFGTYDPMLIRWCSDDHPGSWTTDEAGNAGGGPLGIGSSIKAASVGDREIAIWTDTALYSMVWVGGNNVFNVQIISSDIDIASRNAYVTANNTVFWMGDNNFYSYGRSVEQLDCPVLDKVFDDFGYVESDKIVCGKNSLFNEIIWFYVSSSGTEIDKYVTYNYVNGTWAYGDMSRTAWVDSGIREFPQSAYPESTSGIGYSVILNHEDGYQDDGSKMDSWVESGFLDIPDGDYSMFIDRYVPDYRVISSGGQNRLSTEITIRDYPSSTTSSTSQSTVTPTTEYVNLRLRGRTISVKVTDLLSDGTNDQFGWELGVQRINAKADGRR